MDQRASTRTSLPDFCQLQAGQIMSVPVQTVYEGWSVKRLMKFFVEAEISGAPVIASDGELVGVVSISDIVRFENLPPKEKISVSNMDCYNEYVGYRLSESELKAMFDHADENCTVNQIMTPSVIAVSQETSLPEIAALMREQNIHRVFVQNQNRVVGVVSTSNVLGVIASMCEVSR
ncbi:MAG TPA: CBS domain-containing protein [Candidatus Kapabacteria bacterium]|nr:CBS domain-containing protein [Candidatus Kapabacteria bacterium]